VNPTDHPVLVIDFGAQYAQLIARRIREADVYCEIVPHTITATELAAKKPAALILSGGPASVYADEAPTLDTAVFDLDLPIFGICYGFQLLAKNLGGTVAHTDTAEYGRTELVREPVDSSLFADVPQNLTVWMSHADAVTKAPADCVVTAATVHTPVAAFEHTTRRVAGVQFHPEVLHTEHGQHLLEQFLFTVAGLKPNWTTKSIIDEQVAHIKEVVGDDHAICGLSGGVDSAVAAALVQKAIGSQLTCVFVDHGLLRDGERQQVEEDFVAATGANLVVVDARQRFLAALHDVTDPEEKRKIIGREFIRVFEDAAKDVVTHSDTPVRYLVQGTLYPDVVESGGGSGAANIKSHHNVGGLPDDMEFLLIEPLRTLFKDEVRAVGAQLGLPEAIVWRQPFPGPGLAIRIIGAVDEHRLDLLRHADAIVRHELTQAGFDRAIWQCPVVLLADVRSVGVQGDGRTYGHPIVLRPVSSEDAMTADWTRIDYDVLARISNRITNEVSDVNRVVLDITSKPPGTIEWE
jgi:GMP synthase (glutamine-hydrolysing)